MPHQHLIKDESQKIRFISYNQSNHQYPTGNKQNPSQKFLLLFSSILSGITCIASSSAVASGIISYQHSQDPLFLSNKNLAARSTAIRYNMLKKVICVGLGPSGLLSSPSDILLVPLPDVSLCVSGCIRSLLLGTFPLGWTYTLLGP